MSRTEWLRRKFEASVQQGIGAWMEYAVDPELGQGIYEFHGGPTIRIFENGLIYEGEENWCMCFDDLTGLDLLDLPSLMKAQRVPTGAVQFVVHSASESRVLRLPLPVYTTLSSVLDSIAEKNNRA